MNAWQCLERLIASKNFIVDNSQQASLFGGSSGTPMPPLRVDATEPFSQIDQLKYEKEYLGVYISGHPLDNFKFELDTFCNTQIAALNDPDSMEGKEFKVGGIVASVEHKLTKTGKPFGKLAIEDYSGKVEFTLWSEDYMRLKSFLMPSLFLFIEGNVIRKSWGDNSLELKIKSIDLLNELGVKRTKGLQLKVDLAMLSVDLIKEIEKVCKEYAGSTPLYFGLRDEGENIGLEMLSRKFRVKAVNDMVKQMRKIPDLKVEPVY
jgi:DNA polymerase III subunit alpha